MLIIGIILWGMLIGAAAQWILGATKGSGVNWGMALGAGVLGSFIGGLLGSLIAGEGFAFRPSGIIGSLIGALIVTAIWVWADRRQADS
ncbi:hypothetical protein [Gordonia caeni]|uniref:GlsB/YeaQ/YmgE family stress response membrane protein n=1 Tax=Gordonia caeni TaxID=1007097 RepID=A0ABP7PM89_9ACTN